MILHVFAVRDRATDQFGSPMFLQSTGQAVRVFSDAVNKPDQDSQIYQHPEDFDLFALGRWDSDTGLFDAGAPRQVAIGKDLKVRNSN